MNISIEKKLFSEAVHKAARFAERKAGTLPVLSSLLILAGDDGIKFRATNLETGVDLKVEGKHTSDGVVAVPALVLQQIAASMAGEGVVNLEASGDILSISNGMGKSLVKKVIDVCRDERFRGKIFFIEDYDINIARRLVQGVDVWLNTPRRPYEASGTSGQKVVANGVLNISVSDGWWCEGFEPGVGWAVGAGEEYESADYRDDIESKALFSLLEDELVPRYYTVGADGLPRSWIAMMKNSMSRLGPVFNTTRMVQEYTNRSYMPAYHSWRELSADRFARTREVVCWKERIEQNWPAVEIQSAAAEQGNALVGDRLGIEAEIMLGALTPEDVRVEAYTGPVDRDDNVITGRMLPLEHVRELGEGRHRYRGAVHCQESGRFGFAVRILPSHQWMTGSFALEHVRWIGSEEELAKAA